MSGLTNALVAQQVQALLDTHKRQTDYLTAWLGGSPTGGPNNDGRYPFVDLAGVEILVPAPATFNNMTSGPAALAVAAKAAAELARDLANGHANRANDQRILAEAARGAAVDARNLAQEHKNRAGTSEANAEYWANLARTSGQGSSEDREIVEQLAEQVADNAALAAQDADDAAASAALAATFDPSLYDKKSDSVSAARLTGTLDPARLPSTVFQAPIVASSNIASLTAAQQSEIRIGSTIVTSDGVFWSFLGGIKTLEASYRAMADTTPPWSSIADKPSFFPSNIVNVAGLQSALDGKAPLANAAFSTPISVNGAVGAHSFAANHTLLYPDGNHTVIKTGPSGSERYWRFDANGTFYSLNGGIYSSYDVQAMGSITVGSTTGANRVNIEKGWLELRNDGYGPYVDFSTDATTDFHARISIPKTDGRLWLSHGQGGSVIVGPTIEANSNNGSQAGSVITHAGSEQVMSKQLTFPSVQNPQDNGAAAQLEVRGGGGGYGAWMKFHRPGAYGTYFGMFEDGKWGFGGWSTGGTIYEFWTSKNFNPMTRMERFNNGWIKDSEGTDRFYFGGNATRTYIRGEGVEFRGKGDNVLGFFDNAANLTANGAIHVNGNDLNIYGGSPTIRLVDSDERSAHIHVNSNRFYVLRGGVNDTGWHSVNDGWPLELSLDSGDLSTAGQVFAGNNCWFRVRQNGGLYFETYGGGWYMTDTSWVRVNNGKGVYTSGQIRGGTVVGESDIRLKENVATITNATQTVEALTGVTFDWKRKRSAGMGFIAQDFEQVIPALVTEDTDGMKGIEYGPVVALLVEALKETNERVSALESGRV